MLKYRNCFVEFEVGVFSSCVSVSVAADSAHLVDQLLHFWSVAQVVFQFTGDLIINYSELKQQVDFYLAFKFGNIIQQASQRGVFVRFGRFVITVQFSLKINDYFGANKNESYLDIADDFGLRDWGQVLNLSVEFAHFVAVLVDRLLKEHSIYRILVVYLRALILPAFHQRREDYCHGGTH